jgi:hypothetical protein
MDEESHVDKSRRIIALAASLVLGCSALTLGASPVAASVGHISISVKCSANPETLKVTNNRSSNITITYVGSTYHKRSGEPYYVYNVVKPGHSVTYRFGSGAGANKVTNKFIFDNNAASEKAQVTTNLGIVTKSCGN